jgi:hypothetical protein
MTRLLPEGFSIIHLKSLTINYSSVLALLIIDVPILHHQFSLKPNTHENVSEMSFSKRGVDDFFRITDSFHPKLK